MDVSLPDGTVVKGVPDGMSKGDLVTKLKANGHDVSWYKPEPEAPPAPPTLGQRFMQGVGDISSAPEVVANLATGALGQAVGGWAGIGAIVASRRRGSGRKSVGEGRQCADLPAEEPSCQEGTGASR